MDARQRYAAAVLTSLTFLAATAGAQPVADLELPSCVSGSPPLRMSATSQRAVLDASDRKRFHDAAQARHLLYQRGGLVPTQVLLLRRGSHWQYVTLWRDGTTGLCFSAVFAADRFDFTPGWLAKYEPRAAEPAD